MATLLVRVALPDRPGALGAVASRIGSVRGDVVGVEIVERGDGFAVDEFVVELPEEDNVPLLLAEIAEVDGASVEIVHPLSDPGRDRRIDAYDSAAVLLTERSHGRVLDVLVGLAHRDLDCEWAAVVDTSEPAIVSSVGRPPAPVWLAAHAADSLVGDPGKATADVAWAVLGAWDLMLVVGRPGWRFGAHERRCLEALARLADARWADLAELADRDARTAHPSTVV